MTDVLQMAGLAGGIGGALLVSFKRPWIGHIVWIVANSAWIAYAVITNNNYQTSLFSVYLLLAFIGVWSYRPITKTFRYAALDSLGKEHTGNVKARNAKLAKEIVKKQSLHCISLQEVD